MSDARRRILAAAIQCFASKGYAATTIADIEQAAGLSVGAGGTYRHFESKRAILEAVVDAAVSVPDDEIAPPSDDIEATAHEMLDYMRADMMRIYFRDLDEFPDQRKRINERTIDTSYRRVADQSLGNRRRRRVAAAATLITDQLPVNETLVEMTNGVDRKGSSARLPSTARSVATDPERRPCRSARRRRIHRRRRRRV
jgi:AcrR family transcriptional regulator